MAHPRAGLEVIVKIAGKEFRTVIDERGDQRFVADPVIKYAVDYGLLDLNKLAIAFQEGRFPLEDYLRFYTQTGYSFYGLIQLPQFENLEAENPLD